MAGRGVAGPAMVKSNLDSGLESNRLRVGCGHLRQDYIDSRSNLDGHLIYLMPRCRLAEEKGYDFGGKKKKKLGRFEKKLTNGKKGWVGYLHYRRIHRA